MSSRYDTPPDIEAQLRDIDRQGGGMARFAHFCATALLVAGSIGSLISISAQAFNKFLAATAAGHLDVPDLLNAVVGVLLVLAGDAALLYAASVLRNARSAQMPRDETRVHLWVMIGVSIMEAATYLYMAWLFDKPDNLVIWAIDGGRAIAWPLLAAYLSMARPLPVGPRDVAYHTALASGKGVIRDVATLAADPSAPLQRKVRIYKASATMSRDDLRRFEDIVDAVTADEPVSPPQLITAEHALETVRRELQLNPQHYLPEPDRTPDPPTDGGTPVPSAPVASKLPTPIAPAVANVTPLRRGMGRRPRQDKRTTARANARSGRRGTAEKRVRAALASNPAMTFDELVRQTGVSESTASKWLAVVEAERAVRQPSQTA